MSLIINGTEIPNTGKVVFDGTELKEVVCDGSTVWKKLTKLNPSNGSVKDYLNITGGTPNTCSSHGNCPRFDASVWNARNGGKQSTKTYVIKPKDPYTKITATFYRHGGLVNGSSDKVRCTVNGVNITDVGPYTVTNVSQITLVCYAETNGWDDHWKTECWCCMYGVELSA